MPSDRQKVLAFSIEKNESCPQCGMSDHAEDDDYHVEAYRCTWCEKREYELKSWEEDANSSTAGLKVRIIKNKPDRGAVG